MGRYLERAKGTLEKRELNAEAKGKRCSSGMRKRPDGSGEVTNTRSGRGSRGPGGWRRGRKAKQQHSRTNARSNLCSGVCPTGPDRPGPRDLQGPRQMQIGSSKDRQDSSVRGGTLTGAGLGNIATSAPGMSPHSQLSSDPRHPSSTCHQLPSTSTALVADPPRGAAALA